MTKKEIKFLCWCA